MSRTLPAEYAAFFLLVHGVLCALSVLALLSLLWQISLINLTAIGAIRNDNRI